VNATPEVREKEEDSTERLLLRYLKENLVDDDTSDAIRKSCFARVLNGAEDRHYKTGTHA